MDGYRLTRGLTTAGSARRWLWAAALIYVAVLLLLTFAPTASNPDAPILRTQLLRTIGDALRHAPWSWQFALLIGNLAAFAPLGALVPLLSRRRSARLLFLVALVTSVAIESGQFVVSSLLGYAYRTADVDDVIVNVAGALIGYALFLAATTLTARRANRAA